MANLETQSATNEDFEFAWSLYNSEIKPYIEVHLSRKWIDSEEKERFSKLWNLDDTHIILIDGVKVGWISLNINDSDIEVENFYLLPDYTGRGTGSIILEYFASEAKNQNKSIYTHALKGHPSNEFYEKRGCKIIDHDDICNKVIINDISSSIS